MNESNSRVVIPRALGDWTRVVLDLRSNTVACDCEDYNFGRDCFHCCLFEVLQFAKYPQENASFAADNWQSIREKLMTLVKAHGEILTV